MPTDFSKLQFPAFANTSAASLTEALTADPVDNGFLVLTCKVKDNSDAFLVSLRAFVAELRADAQNSDLTDITAYRQVMRSELGGTVPFDQPVCEALLDRVARNQDSEAKGIGVESIVLNNPRADWIVLLEYSTPDAALSASQQLTNGLGSFADAVSEYTVGSFANKHQYSRIPHNPDVIHFFN
ncbi:MAG: hypothetical protein WAS05_04480 [Candidatus Nanopelagicales bacterium]